MKKQLHKTLHACFFAMLLLLAQMHVKAQSFTEGNLAVFLAASASASNTTGSIIELNTSGSLQTGLSHAISGTDALTALRFREARLQQAILQIAMMAHCFVLMVLIIQIRVQM